MDVAGINIFPEFLCQLLNFLSWEWFKVAWAFYQRIMELKQGREWVAESWRVDELHRPADSTNLVRDCDYLIKVSVVHLDVQIFLWPQLQQSLRYGLKEHDI
jgi:hypothetical protein